MVAFVTAHNCHKSNPRPSYIVSTTIPSNAGHLGEASDLGCRLLTAEDRGIAPGKLVEAGRSPPENRLDER